jgi:hypothetical protein
VIVTTAGPAEVSTVAGLIASDARTGAFVSPAAALSAIRPSETTAKRSTTVVAAAITDRRRRAKSPRRGRGSTGIRCTIGRIGAGLT